MRSFLRGILEMWLSVQVGLEMEQYSTVLNLWIPSKLCCSLFCYFWSYLSWKGVFCTTPPRSPFTFHMHSISNLLFKISKNYFLTDFIAFADCEKVIIQLYSLKLLSHSHSRNA